MIEYYSKIINFTYKIYSVYIIHSIPPSYLNEYKEKKNQTNLNIAIWYIF